jgi:hypothetical protein
MELHAGIELKCPNCPRWHLVYAHEGDTMISTRHFLWFRCAGQEYFASPLRFELRWPTDRPIGQAEEG